MTRQRPGWDPGAEADDSTSQAVTGNGTSQDRQVAGQRSFDDLPPPARVTDPPASWAAARALDGGKIAKQVERVVVVVAARGNRGSTCWDVHRALGADRANTSKRLGDAVRKGYLRTDGTRRVPTGRHQTIYFVTASGQTLAARHLAEVS